MPLGGRGPAHGTTCASSVHTVSLVGMGTDGTPSDYNPRASMPLCMENDTCVTSSFPQSSGCTPHLRSLTRHPLGRHVCDQVVQDVAPDGVGGVCVAGAGDVAWSDHSRDRRRHCCCTIKRRVPPSQQPWIVDANPLRAPACIAQPPSLTRSIRIDSQQGEQPVTAARAHDGNIGRGGGLRWRQQLAILQGVEEFCAPM